ncbi:3-deoxy-D-manno-octulosonic acid transferase [Vibrio breoganii]|uniref:lipid IV(A) 3-deoxy-D-manno-octulosonic acid transferase n=1 Tax=Vibrio breoganii TaxID=553239 RepID=UPI000C857286|nr:lipid IV(A) 3-deoxy-D-manno-octulosonic acid transferase [Vibrio breoganii]PMO91533.1 3-deoxy-D-manno-octulosonic acid transferase [Vibrio breoganii]
MISRIILLIYTLLIAVLSPILLYTLMRKREGKPFVGCRWKEYFGFCEPYQGESPIWIHAVSVGEVIGATGFIKALKKQHPNKPILITTTTPTGAQQAQKLSAIAEHRYMPIDFAWCVRLFIRRVEPRCLIIMETELWPNTLHLVSKNNIPITVLNARLSQKSFNNYKKIQPVFNVISQSLTQVLCQTTEDAIYFERLGIDKGSIATVGSLKFDIEIPKSAEQQAKVLRNFLGKDRRVWIAASTHEGEDEEVYKAHSELKKTIPDALLVIVPRHPERFTSVLKLSSHYGLKAISRTSNQEITPEVDVYVADTMGEMLLLIGAADVCFMAGSLLGNKVGGHNVLEPAALGKPILNGPSYYNFKEIVNKLLEKGAINICNNSQELSSELEELFSNPHRCTEQGSKGRRFVELNRGAINASLVQVDNKISVS